MSVQRRVSEERSLEEEVVTWRPGPVGGQAVAGRHVGGGLQPGGGGGRSLVGRPMGTKSAGTPLPK